MKAKELTHVTTWMNPDGTVIRHVSQTLRVRSCHSIYTRYRGGEVIATEGRMEVLGQEVMERSGKGGGEDSRCCKCVPCC